MSSSLPTFGIVDTAIVNALRKHPKGLRYNALQIKSGEEIGQRLWVKTYNEHLKRLVKIGVVERVEKTRFKVFYKLKIPETSEAKLYVSNVRKLETELKQLLFEISELIAETRENDTSKREYMEVLSALIEYAVILSTVWIEELLRKAIEFYHKNPAWSRFVIDEATQILQEVFSNFVELLGGFGKVDPFITKILKRMEGKSLKRITRLNKRLKAKIREFKMK